MPRRRHAAAALAAVVALAVAATASAQTAPTWVVADTLDSASVAAFTYPSGVAQLDTAIVILCDADAPSGLNVLLWIGEHGVRPAETDALVRRDQGEIQRYPWFVGANGDRATPKFFNDVERFVDELRRGGTMALRFLLLPGVPDANQPTFQFVVDGFAEVERQLRCGASDDPFASGGSAAPDPVAAPPAAAAPAAVPAPVAPSPRSGRAAPVAPPPAPATPSAPTGAAPWFLDPSGLELSFDADDRTFGFFCLDDGELIAFFILPTTPISTDADGAAAFTFEFAGGSLPADTWAFFDLGDGLYATDTNTSFLLLFGIGFVDGVRVSHGGVTLFDAPTGPRFEDQVVQLACI